MDDWNETEDPYKILELDKGSEVTEAEIKKVQSPTPFLKSLSGYAGCMQQEKLLMRHTYCLSALNCKKVFTSAYSQGLTLYRNSCGRKI